MKNLIIINIAICLVFIISFTGYTSNTFANVKNQKYEFKTLPNSIFPRDASCSVVVLKDGCVLITGGMKDKYNSTNTAEIFDPVKRKFIKTSNMIHSRANHSTILLNDGNVLIIGGSTITNKNSPKLLKEAEIYNPKTKEFTEIGKMSFAGNNLQMFSTNNGNILIFRFKNLIEIFNLKKYKFQQYNFSQKYSIDSFLSGILLTENNILFPQYINPSNNKFGGEYSFNLFFINKMTGKTLDYVFPYYKYNFVLQKINEDNLLLIDKYGNESLIYNLSSNSIKRAGKLNTSRDFKLSSILLNDGNIMIIDGARLRKGTFISKYEALKSVEIYNAEQNRFIKLNNTHYARANVKLIKLSDGNVLILGDFKHPELLVIKNKGN